VNKKKESIEAGDESIEATREGSGFGAGEGLRV